MIQVNGKDILTISNEEQFEYLVKLTKKELINIIKQLVDEKEDSTNFNRLCFIIGVLYRLKKNGKKVKECRRNKEMQEAVADWEGSTSQVDLGTVIFASFKRNR